MKAVVYKPVGIEEFQKFLSEYSGKLEQKIVGPLWAQKMEFIDWSLEPEETVVAFEDSGGLYILAP